MWIIFQLHGLIVLETSSPWNRVEELLDPYMMPSGSSLIITTGKLEYFVGQILPEFRVADGN
jgi:hypothetical protein